MLPEIGLAKGACTLWQDQQLFDYTIEVDDEQFKVHKVIMASVSDYFRVMLTGDMLESREDKVRLEGLEPLAVKNMIEYIYTGKFGSSKASAVEHLICAMYLQIAGAVNMCTMALCEEVNRKNCHRILTIFQTYGLKHGIEYTAKFIKLNCEDILEVCNIDELSYEEFINLVDYWGTTEDQLFVTAMKWVKKDYEKRKEHLDEIMSRMRFCLMTPAELGSIISDPNDPWHDRIEKALRYHNLPIHQKVLEESVEAKVRHDPSPVCFGMPLSSTSGQLFTVREKNSWKARDVANPEFNEKFDFEMPHQSTHINNFYIASVNRGEHDVELIIFDPRTMSWSVMAPMTIPRDRCSLVYHENHLYALGGVDRRDESGATDVIEKYDFHTNTWSVITSRMPVPMWYAQAFSIGDRIYIFGGYRNGQDYSDTLYCLNLENGEWSETPVPYERYCSNKVVVQMNGEKVLAYFDHRFDLHLYNPSDDKWYVKYVPTKMDMDGFDVGQLHAMGDAIFLVNYDVRSGICEKWTLVDDTVQVSTVADHPRPSSVTRDGRVSLFGALLATP